MLANTQIANILVLVLGYSFVFLFVGSLIITVVKQGWIKTAFVIWILLVVFLFLSSCGHATRYLVGKNEGDEKMKEMLIMELNHVSFPHAYILNFYDCSNMTAFLYVYLTQRGYKCTIITGAKSLSGLFNGDGHAWLVVEKDGKKFVVDSVEKTVVSVAYHNKYKWQVVWRSLKILQSLEPIFNFFGFENEWAY